MYVYMHGCTNGPSVVVRAMCVRVYVVVKAWLLAWLVGWLVGALCLYVLYMALGGRLTHFGGLVGCMCGRTTQVGLEWRM